TSGRGRYSLGHHTLDRYPGRRFWRRWIAVNRSRSAQVIAARILKAGVQRRGLARARWRGFFADLGRAASGLFFCVLGRFLCARAAGSIGAAAPLARSLTKRWMEEAICEENRSMRRSRGVLEGAIEKSPHCREADGRFSNRARQDFIRRARDF